MSFKKLSIQTLEVMGKNMKDIQKEYEEKAKKDKKGAEKLFKEIKANKAKLDAYNKAADNVMKDYVSNCDLYAEIVLGYEKDAEAEVKLAEEALKAFKEKHDIGQLMTVNTLPLRLKKMEEDFAKTEQEYRAIQMPLRAGLPGAEPYKVFWDDAVAAKSLADRQKTIDDAKVKVQPALLKIEQLNKVANALVSQADVAKIAYTKGKKGQEEQVEEIKKTLKEMIEEVREVVEKDQKNSLPNMNRTMESTLKNLQELNDQKGKITADDFRVKVLARIAIIKDNLSRGRALSEGMERTVKVHMEHIGPEHRKDKEVTVALQQVSQWIKAGKLYVSKSEDIAREAATLAKDLSKRVAA